MIYNQLIILVFLFVLSLFPIMTAVPSLARYTQEECVFGGGIPMCRFLCRLLFLCSRRLEYRAS